MSSETEAVNSKEFFEAEQTGEAKYEVSQVIGRGSYGIVCAARNRYTGEKVAIKHIDRVLADKADTVRIIRELRFLRLLKHPNIIAVHDVLLPSQRKDFDAIYIVFELLDTDLAHLIRSKTRYEEVHIQWLLYQLFAGLRHIHDANVFHRDLKPGNILVNANCDLKICDFGLARADFTDVSKHTVFWTDYVATRWYRAPELICSYFTRYSAAVDIWAAGCICAELLRRKPLFPGHSVYQQIELITNLTGSPTVQEIGKVRNPKAREYLSSLPEKPKPDWHALFPDCHPLAVDLLRKILTFDPDARLSAAECMAHPYFEMFQDVGHDRLAGPPPVMTKADFTWESEKQLTTEQLREILFQEIQMYHPELEGGGGSYASTACEEVRGQFSALERGDIPARTATSLPAEQTAPLYAQAQRMHAADGGPTVDMLDSPVSGRSGGISGGIASAGGGTDAMMQMEDGGGNQFEQLGDDTLEGVMGMVDAEDDAGGYVDDVDGCGMIDSPTAGEIRTYGQSQSISAENVRRLASSAVTSIVGEVDDVAMHDAAASMAERATSGPQWQAAPHLAAGGSKTVTQHCGNPGQKDLLEVMKEKTKQKKQREAAVTHGHIATGSSAAGTMLSGTTTADPGLAGTGDGGDDANDQCLLM